MPGVWFRAEYVVSDSIAAPVACQLPLEHRQIDAFHFLMSTSKDRSHLPSTIEPHEQTARSNRTVVQVIEYMKSTGLGFTLDTACCKIVKTLRDSLWYIDTAHQQFEERLFL